MVTQRRRSPACCIIILVVLIGALAVALPRLHQDVPLRVGHYKTPARFYQAQQAHSIFADPSSQCTTYDCDSSDAILRVCLGKLDTGDVVHAVQWLITGPAGDLLEGTSFVQRVPDKVTRYLHNNGCRQMVQ